MDKNLINGEQGVIDENTEGKSAHDASCKLLLMLQEFVKNNIFASAVHPSRPWHAIRK